LQNFLILHVNMSLADAVSMCCKIVMVWHGFHVNV